MPRQCSLEVRLGGQVRLNATIRKHRIGSHDQFLFIAPYPFKILLAVWANLGISRDLFCTHRTTDHIGHERPPQNSDDQDAMHRQLILTEPVSEIQGTHLKRGCIRQMAVLPRPPFSLSTASPLPAKLFAPKGQPDASPGQSATAKPYSAALGLDDHGKTSPERAALAPKRVSPFQGLNHRVRSHPGASLRCAPG